MKSLNFRKKIRRFNARRTLEILILHPFISHFETSKFFVFSKVRRTFLHSSAVPVHFRQLVFIFLLILAGCAHRQHFASADLAIFYQKADLSTEQIYQQLVINQPDQLVSLFIRCTDCTPEQQDSLKALSVEIRSVNQNIVTARVPAEKIPAVAELPFVTAIENARAGKFR